MSEEARETGSNPTQTWGGFTASAETPVVPAGVTLRILRRAKTFFATGVSDEDISEVLGISTDVVQAISELDVTAADAEILKAEPEKLEAEIAENGSVTFRELQLLRRANRVDSVFKEEDQVAGLKTSLLDMMKDFIDNRGVRSLREAVDAYKALDSSQRSPVGSIAYKGNPKAANNGANGQTGIGAGSARPIHVTYMGINVNGKQPSGKVGSNTGVTLNEHGEVVGLETGDGCITELGNVTPDQVDQMAEKLEAPTHATLSSGADVKVDAKVNLPSDAAVAHSLGAEITEILVSARETSRGVLDKEKASRDVEPAGMSGVFKEVTGD